MDGYLQLSKFEMQQLLGFMDHCLYITQADQIHDALGLLQKIIPFEHAALCTVGSPVGQEAALFELVAHTHEPRWVSAYLANGHHRVDPIVGYAFGQAKPFCWRTALQATAADDILFHEFMESAADFGLHNGAAYRIASSVGDSRHILLSVSFFRDMSPDHYPHLSEQYLRVMELGLPHIRRAVDRLAANESYSSDVRMTPRELDVMQWASAGKTSWEIARILGITERTVKFHFTSVFVKLNVVNRSQAVAKAIRCGLIPALSHLPVQAMREGMRAKA